MEQQISEERLQPGRMETCQELIVIRNLKIAKKMDLQDLGYDPSFSLIVTGKK